MIVTNIMTYRAIAEDAYSAMQAEVNKRCRPKSDGTPGCIIEYDPHHTSFKQAMICLAFTGMWFEAAAHLYIMEWFGEEKARAWDRNGYRKKLHNLGCTDESLLTRVHAFSDSRNELMHENAHFHQDTLKTVEEEATKGYFLMKDIAQFFQDTQNQRVS